MKRVCKCCGTIVETEADRELRKEYPYYCPRCEENKYTFETEAIEIPENATEILYNRKKIILDSTSDRAFEDYICPNCKIILQQRQKGARRVTVYKFKHCYECGQLLDWNLKLN